MQQIVEQTIQVLKSGGTILYPTDTIWGLGCDARNAEAVERLYSIKARDHSKSMLVLCTGRMLADSDSMPESADSRPTTFILPAERWRHMLRAHLAPNLAAADGSLGIRMPQHRFCQAVIDGLGAPIVSTSANLSGQPSPQGYDDIAAEVKARVDFCVPPLPEFLSGATSGSRIVKLEADGTVTVIRP